jgi:hypothetical protein
MDEFDIIIAWGYVFSVALLLGWSIMNVWTWLRHPEPPDDDDPMSRDDIPTDDYSEEQKEAA